MLKKILLSCVLASAFAFAAEVAPAAAPSAESAAPAETAVAVDSAAAPAEAAVETVAENAAPSVEKELKEEIAVRDSVMAVQSESCSAEKDSLRKSLEVEQAKSANWEKSYEAMKKDNALCAQALNVSIGVNEKKKEQSQEDKLQASSMAAGTFLGGIGIGILIFWLITR